MHVMLTIPSWLRAWRTFARWGGAVIALTLLPVFLYHIFWALKTASCDYALIAPRAQMEAWNANQIPTIPLSKWLPVEQRLNEQQLRCPADPQIPADLANLYMLRLPQAAAVPKVQTFFASIALTYMGQSIQQRPAMALNWANTALLKAMLGQFDLKYAEALNTALLLAPHDARNIQTVMLASVPYRSKLASMQLDAIQKAYLSLPSYQRKKLQPWLIEQGLAQWVEL